jgi:hypothetical protein
MGWDDDDGLNEFLEFLVDGGYLEGAALGVTKKILDGNDLENLSPKQQSVFEKYVLGPYESTCPGCGEQIPWRDKVGDPDKSVCNNCSSR